MCHGLDLIVGNQAAACAEASALQRMEGAPDSAAVTALGAECLCDLVHKFDPTLVGQGLREGPHLDVETWVVGRFSPDKNTVRRVPGNDGDAA